LLGEEAAEGSKSAEAGLVLVGEEAAEGLGAGAGSGAAAGAAGLELGCLGDRAEPPESGLGFFIWNK
jgi:hypothetical protein